MLSLMKKHSLFRSSLFVLFLHPLQTMADSDPSMDSLMQWGRVAERELEIERARDFFTRASALNPSAPLPVKALLELSEKYETPEICLDQLNSALSRFPYEAEFYVMKSRLLRLTASLGPARSAWQKAEGLNPQSAAVRIEDIDLLLSEGYPSEALAKAQNLFAQNKTAAASQALISALLANQVTDEAERVARKAMASEESPPLHWLGRQFRVGGAEKFQEKILRQWVNHKPLLHEPQRLLGENLMRQKRATEAAKVLSQALLLNPSDLSTLRLYLQSAKGLEASLSEKQLQSFLAMNPDSAEAWRLRLNFLKSRERIEDLGQESLALKKKAPDWSWVDAYLLYVDLRLDLTNSQDPRFNADSRLTKTARTALKLMAEYKDKSRSDLESRLHELQSQGELPGALVEHNLRALAKKEYPASKASLSEHKIKNGETLRLVSLYHFGTKDKWQEIWNLNRDRLKHPGRIQVGQLLRLPLPSTRAPAQVSQTPWTDYVWDEEQL